MFSCEFCEIFINTFFYRSFPGDYFWICFGNFNTKSISCLLQMFHKIRWKHLRWSPFWIKFQARPATSLKRDSNPGIFRWILQNFQEHLRMTTSKNLPWHVWFTCREYVLYMETLNFKIIKLMNTRILRSSHPEVFLIKDILKICSKFTLEHPCRSVTSIKLQSNFIKILLRLKCSPVNLLHIFRNLSQETPLDGCFSILLQNHSKQQTSIVICNLNQLPPDFHSKS